MAGNTQTAISVLAHSAKGDNSTDDTAAIQAAVGVQPQLGAGPVLTEGLPRRSARDGPGHGAALAGLGTAGSCGS